MPAKIASLTTALSQIQKEKNCILLWTGAQDRHNRNSFLFLDPKDILLCRRLEDIRLVFDKIQTYLERGFFAAGYIAYEAGFAFEESLKSLISPQGLLMWFGIYRKAHTFKQEEDILKNNDYIRKNYELKSSGLNITENEYKFAVGKIKRYIAQGETYQVNYTIKKHFEFKGNPYALFYRLCRNQEVPYAAFIKNEQEYILSLSPELFFRRDRGTLTVKPMKGTIERGKVAQEDYAQALRLKHAAKERAENIMIVDLLRNDLGRVSQIGSVKARSLFDTERLNTLWQMTSTVTCRIKKNLSWYDIFANIFPSGSVTGAPKIKTMEIIRRLERSERGVYTGAIGYLGPRQEAVFNVAIRTLRIDRSLSQAELGIGSGIVWDSLARKEWLECQAKSLFLHDGARDFQLIETMGLRQGKVILLDAHLERLEESAHYFKFCFQRSKILEALARFIQGLDKTQEYKLRLLLFPDGRLTITDQKLPGEAFRKPKVIFASCNTKSDDVFLYHKTTRRDMYNQEHVLSRQRGYFDCLFKNEKGEVTEGAISNIFIERNSKLYTPRLSCGLLNGVYRRYLCALARPKVWECVLYEDDIRKADKLYLSNAVSGIIKVKLDQGK